MVGFTNPAVTYIHVHYTAVVDILEFIIVTSLSFAQSYELKCSVN